MESIRLSPEDSRRIERIHNLITALESIDADPEEGHREADDLLLAFINDPRVTLAFKKLPKWYA